MKYLRYFLYVLSHKYHVARYCFKLGLYREAFTHDLSKFWPDEFIPHARYWYHPEGMDAPKGKINRRVDFMKAKTLHFSRNPHHLCPAPFLDRRHILEACANWLAMGYVRNEKASNYYIQNIRSVLKLPPFDNDAVLRILRKYEV